MDAGDSEIVVFTLPVCPTCERVKAALTDAGIAYAEMGMDTADGITELRVNGCFAMEAPVVLYQGEFLEHEELVDGDGEVVQFWDADRG